MNRNALLAVLIVLGLVAGAVYVKTPAPKANCPCGVNCPCTPTNAQCPCCEPDDPNRPPRTYVPACEPPTPPADTVQP